MANSIIEKTWKTVGGYKAACLFVNDSHRCGYVGISRKHPLYGKGYSDICPELQPLWEEAQGQPIGKRGIIPVFCAMGKDFHNQLTPDLVFNVHGGITFADKGRRCLFPRSPLWWFGFDCGHSGDRTRYSGGIVRTLEYVVTECESLAEQLKKVETVKVILEVTTI